MSAAFVRIIFCRFECLVLLGFHNVQIQVQGRKQLTLLYDHSVTVETGYEPLMAALSVPQTTQIRTLQTRSASMCWKVTDEKHTAQAEKQFRYWDIFLYWLGLALRESDAIDTYKTYYVQWLIFLFCH